MKIIELAVQKMLENKINAVRSLLIEKIDEEIAKRQDNLMTANATGRYEQAKYIVSGISKLQQLRLDVEHSFDFDIDDVLRKLFNFRVLFNDEETEIRKQIIEIVGN